MADAPSFDGDGSDGAVGGSAWAYAALEVGDSVGAVRAVPHTVADNSPVRSEAAEAATSRAACTRTWRGGTGGREWCPRPLCLRCSTVSVHMVRIRAWAWAWAWVCVCFAVAACHHWVIASAAWLSSFVVVCFPSRSLPSLSVSVSVPIDLCISGLSVFSAIRSLRLVLLSSSLSLSVLAVCRCVLRVRRRREGSCWCPRVFCCYWPPQ